MADLSSTKVFGKLTVIHDAILKANAEITGNVTVTGTITGNGSGLTTLNATNLASGTVAEARLPASALVGDTTYTAGTGLSLTGTTFALTDEAYTTTEKNKLAGIETGATADQTASEIKTAYESNLDTNAFTDALQTKLNGIAAGADDYSSWTISDGTNTEAILSGNTLTVAGSGATSAVYDSVSNTLTISSTDTNTDTTYSAGTGLSLTGTTFALTDESYTTTEKTKLSGIESGATADQTATEILTSIKTVDGTGSGLDADLLDGQHAAAFLEKSGGTMTGALTLNADPTVNLGAATKQYVDANSGDTTLGTLTQSFITNQQESVMLSGALTDAAVVSVTKEVPQLGVTTDNWQTSVDGNKYDVEDTAYATTITPSATSGNITLTLGAGSFTTGDIGKTIIGNGGKAVLTAANGSAIVTTPFTNTTAIASGNWTMESVVFDGDSAEVSNYILGFSNISGASYDTVSFSVAGQDTNPYDIVFNNDGTKMYILGGTNDTVHQYSLATAFDLSTTSYDTVSLSVGGQDTNPYDIVFNNDGTKMYMVGGTNDTVHQYTLLTGFDLSTASYDSVSFSVGGQDTTPYGIAFSNDGTKMYMVGSGSGSVHQYSLATAFDLSTASYDTVSLSVEKQDTTPYDIAFNNDGTKMYMVGITNDTVHQYSLATAFDLSTASYDTVSLSVAGQDTTPLGIAFSNDGTKMYMVGISSRSVHQYSVPVSTSYAFTSTYASTITNNLGQIDSTFWTDINSASSTEVLNGQTVLYSFSTDGQATFQIVRQNEGARNIVRNSAGTWQVNTNTTYALETWAAAAENTVWGALREAMSTLANKMPPAQLAAATDADFPATGDTLDLAITLYTDTAIEIPKSSGVLLNYDANVMKQGAINGTDYEWDQPSNTEVRIRALKPNNLRVRVV